ncbi:MAG: hypothetical protein U5J97_00035 [Trueperaceae bacterium]|nr:hypothetical protein [Trueperaceae bacterium]
MLVYLDQNHASRIAKHLLGQTSHEAFGELHRALLDAGPLVPPSPFHVLETRGGYLLPTLQVLFGQLSRGTWVRPWQQVVRRQALRGGLDRTDLLTSSGDWSRPATLDPLRSLLDVPLVGTDLARRRTVHAWAAQWLNVPVRDARGLPFFDLLARLVAFRSVDEERADRPSDLTDLVMAATVAPYVDALATDRYVSEILGRVGHDGPVFSGRRPDVLRFARWLRERRDRQCDSRQGRERSWT